MKACKSCKWWGADERRGLWKLEPWHPLEGRKMTQDELGGEARYCGAPNVAMNEYPQPGGASVFDASDYNASFATSESFSCCLWERTE